jgi:hypothetical protein
MQTGFGLVNYSTNPTTQNKPAYFTGIKKGQRQLPACVKKSTYSREKLAMTQ